MKSGFDDYYRMAQAYLEGDAPSYPACSTPVGIYPVIIELVGRRDGPVSLSDITEGVSTFIPAAFDFEIRRMDGGGLQDCVERLEHDGLLIEVDRGYRLTSNGIRLLQETRKGMQRLFGGGESEIPRNVDFKEWLAEQSDELVAEISGDFKAWNMKGAEIL